MYMFMFEVNFKIVLHYQTSKVNTTYYTNVVLELIHQFCALFFHGSHMTRKGFKIFINISTFKFISYEKILEHIV